MIIFEKVLMYNKKQLSSCVVLICSYIEELENTSEIRHMIIFYHCQKTPNFGFILCWNLHYFRLLFMTIQKNELYTK